MLMAIGWADFRAYERNIVVLHDFNYFLQALLGKNVVVIPGEKLLVAHLRGKEQSTNVAGNAEVWLVNVTDPLTLAELPNVVLVPIGRVHAIRVISDVNQVIARKDWQLENLQ
jgi:hypothetical protein